jgi:hypothetical protein
MNLYKHAEKSTNKMNEESLKWCKKVVKNELEKCLQDYTKCYKSLNINNLNCIF